MKRMALVAVMLLLAAGISGCSPDDSANGGAVTDEVAATDQPAQEPQIEVGILNGSNDAELQAEPTDDDAAAIETDDDAEADAEPSEDAEERLEPIEITTDTVRSAVAGKDYGHQLIRAHGGSGEYLWEVEGLPEGMVVNCSGKRCDSRVSASKARLDGTPSKVGSFDLVVRVTDAKDAGLSAERALTLTVEENVALITGVANAMSEMQQAVVNAMRESGEAVSDDASIKVTVAGLKDQNAKDLVIDPATKKLVKPLLFLVGVSGAEGNVELTNLAKDENTKKWVPHQDEDVQDFAKFFQCTMMKANTMWLCKIDRIYFDGQIEDPTGSIDVRACDSKNNCDDTHGSFKIRIQPQHIKEFTVHACRMVSGAFGIKSEECVDNPPELTLKFYEGATLQAVYNENGYTAGPIVLAQGGMNVKNDKIDRITAYQHYRYGEEAVTFTKITIVSPNWRATSDSLFAPNTFLSLETDITSGMVGYDEDKPEGIWQRVFGL